MLNILWPHHVPRPKQVNQTCTETTPSLGSTLQKRLLVGPEIVCCKKNDVIVFSTNWVRVEDTPWACYLSMKGHIRHLLTP